MIPNRVPLFKFSEPRQDYILQMTSPNWNVLRTHRDLDFQIWQERGYSRYCLCDCESFIVDLYQFKMVDYRVQRRRRVVIIYQLTL